MRLYPADVCLLMTWISASNEDIDGRVFNVLPEKRWLIESFLSFTADDALSDEQVDFVIP